jgi:hypothetical protein
LIKNELKNFILFFIISHFYSPPLLYPKIISKAPLQNNLKVAFVDDIGVPHIIKLSVIQVDTFVKRVFAAPLAYSISLYFSDTKPQYAKVFI